MKPRNSPPKQATPLSLLQHGQAYWFDACQRSVLFWDVLRQRGNIYLEHRQQGKPAVLDFDYEMIMDGRTLPRPCNYALLRILPHDGIETDPGKRPFVIVDPRAGHGPGIGGSKYDSQVGVALHAGHPVYFVTFFPQPMPGQGLLEIAEAEALFIEDVARRHPQAEGKPCVVGNCQAGWAVAALASIVPEIVGPILLNGAPLAYWSGVDGHNPMRYAGGLLGGKWLATLSSDLGNGKFDGAHLVSNFEKLNPANTLWTKQYNLYAKVDSEAPRFLDFEKWWGGFFLMNAQEIDAIVSDLFIGNKLARGQIVTQDGLRVDLKNIRSPIIIFASFGDNITPPQQALNWIVDVYGHEDNIVNNDDVIVYLLNEHIGHLGIFVSSRIARKETTELVGTLEMIDRLPPGLYEMIIEPGKPGMKAGELEPGEFTVGFEIRTIQDILELDDTRREEEFFNSVAAVSEMNDSLYRAFLQPWVRVLTSEPSAELLRNLHPLRLQRSLFCDLNPLMWPLSWMADSTRRARQPVHEDNVFLQLEQQASQMIVDGLDFFRDTRDAWNSFVFKSMYGAGGLSTLFPSEAPRVCPEEQAREHERLRRRREELETKFEAGGPLEAAIRMIVAAAARDGRIERRSMLMARELRLNSEYKNLNGAEMRALIRDQFAVLRLDEDRALRALAKLLPTRRERDAAVAFVRQVLLADPEEVDFSDPLVARISEILEVDLAEPALA